MPILPPDPTTHEAYDIVYEDLVNEVLKFLKSLCNNIGTLNVRDNFKYGKTFVINSHDVLKDGHRKAHTKTIEGEITDGLNIFKEPVTEQTIKTQFNDFLTLRGIAISKKKGKEIISMKSMMNFYANIATFITTKLVIVTNDFTPKSDRDGGVSRKRYVFYNPQNTNYGSNISIQPDINFSNANVQSFTEDLINAIRKTTHSYAVKTKLTFSSCSSSSSSSSSSCSSSCSSSSSSFFIAFMEI